MKRLSPADYKALATFRYLLRKFLRFSKDFLRSTAKITPEQYEALLAIKAFGTADGLTISQLSEALQVKHHSAVNIVDRLAERTLITRRAGEIDRRHRYLQLTVKGEKLIRAVASVHRKEIRARSLELIKTLKKLKK